ncbi:MAG TPA: efflux RND transporter periplasmic adaptor subunit [Stellaceae bacterium]|jgi:multidrug efflux system membrane fusion protein|nr:efflux RND transporter periplasmic adaptor subunit [Stellaceae bacterium]
MRKGVIAALAVLAIVGAAWLLPRAFQPSVPAVAQTPPSSPPGGPGVPVTAGTVSAADVPVVLSTIGTVQAFNMVTIKSRVDGQIVAAQFTEGQDVKAGDPLLQIDPRPFQAALEQAQAAKEKDEAQLVSAQADLARWAELVGQGFKSRQTYDQQKALVAQLQASIKGDEAAISNARLNLGYAAIRSPISGRIGAKLVDVGNMVRSADAAGLLTVAQLKPIFTSFTIAQENAHKIRERQARAPLDVLAYGHDNKTLLGTGKLTLIDNAIDQASGTIRLKATFDNNDERLWPGEFVYVRLILNTRRGVPTVPAQTVQDGSTGQYAYVIKEDNTVERRDVEVSIVQDGIAVVTKGLSPGEKVVVEGQHRLTKGARVRIAAPGRGAAG